MKIPQKWSYLKGISRHLPGPVNGVVVNSLLSYGNLPRFDGVEHKSHCRNSTLLILQTYTGLTQL